MKQKKHILIADDEKQLLQPLEFILRAHDFKVTAAENGFQALRNYIFNTHNNDPIDLLITDIQMPGITGIDLIDEIRERDPLLPILIITGYASRLTHFTIARECLMYIEKPFTEELILSSVQELFKTRQRLQSEIEKASRD